MTQPIQIRGDWWYEQADGSWLKWDESRGTWLAQSLPPPPPTEAPSTTSQGAVVTPSPESQANVVQTGAVAPSQPAGEAVQPYAPMAADRPPPASDYPQVITRAYEPAPAMGPMQSVITPAAEPGERLPADQLIVSESYVVSTQQSGGVALPTGAPGSVTVEHVAPNVTRVTSSTAVETSVPPPPEQVRAMSLTKLSESERSATQQRLAVLGSCLSAGERLVGLTFGTEQATGHAGLIAITDRQMLFIGQQDGGTQLFCPLDQIELVGYEDIGGSARLSVTANGRVTTWRDIIPPHRAAEVSQLVENRGARAKAVAAPVLPPANEARPAPSTTPVAPYDAASVQSTGGVAVHRTEPAPSEIVIPDARPQATGWKGKTKAFFQDLWNDPTERTQTQAAAPGTALGYSEPVSGAYRAGYGYHAPTSSKKAGMGARTRSRLMAGGALAIGLLSFVVRYFWAWLVMAIVAMSFGYSLYSKNRGSLRDQVTEGLSAAAIIAGGVSLGLALLDYF